MTKQVKTNNLDLAGLLVAKGYKPISLERLPDTEFYEFYFKDDPKIKELIMDYTTGTEVLVNAFEYSTARRQLKRWSREGRIG